MEEALLRPLEHFTGKSRLQLAMEETARAPVRDIYLFGATTAFKIAAPLPSTKDEGE